MLTESFPLGIYDSLLFLLEVDVWILHDLRKVDT